MMLNVRQFQESDVHSIELGYEFTPESRVGLCNHDNIVGYTLVDGEEILAVGGAHVMWFGVGELWVLVSPEAKRRAAPFARYTKGVVDTIFEEHKLRRMQASVHVKDHPAIRFAEWLGLEHEGIMRKYGVRGEDYIRMARVV